MRFVIAITGASGALYAVRLLKAGLELGLDLDVVASDYGKRLLIDECDLNLKTTSIEDWLNQRYGDGDYRGSLTLHSVHDLGAVPASGSVHWDGMAVVPCSMTTLSGRRPHLSRDAGLLPEARELRGPRRLRRRPRLVAVGRPQPTDQTLAGLEDAAEAEVELEVFVVRPAVEREADIEAQRSYR